MSPKYWESIRRGTDSATAERHLVLLCPSSIDNGLSAFIMSKIPALIG
jgi:hypothetical protein